MSKKINLTFIFSGGRKDRLSKDEIYAKDFFYGYFGFSEDDYNSKIVEFEPIKTLFPIFVLYQFLLFYFLL